MISTREVTRYLKRGRSHQVPTKFGGVHSAAMPTKPNPLSRAKVRFAVKALQKSAKTVEAKLAAIHELAGIKAKLPEDG